MAEEVALETLNDDDLEEEVQDGEVQGDSSESSLTSVESLPLIPVNKSGTVCIVTLFNHLPTASQSVANYF